MAATTGFISSSRTSAFLSGETSSFTSPPFSSPSSSFRFALANLRMDPQNKRIIVCDEKLKIFAGKDRVGFLEVAGLIIPHFL